MLKCVVLFSNFTTKPLMQVNTTRRCSSNELQSLSITPTGFSYLGFSVSVELSLVRLPFTWAACGVLTSVKHCTGLLPSMACRFFWRLFPRDVAQAASLTHFGICGRVT